MLYSVDKNFWMFDPENLSEAGLKSNGLIYLAKDLSKHCIRAVVLLLLIVRFTVSLWHGRAGGTEPKDTKGM